ncbi:hypothetical protein GCM10022197_06710 [Microlunatus spumicola]|uniref:DUF1697 domain-containing protein n=1 Tax=Microlunatus spumicola TaxID=81499 RepID=A0ABP6WUI2_9ACTN
MTTYVAFLHGVNLGRSRRVAMPRLAALARELGHDDVWTWASSGNLVLSTGRPAEVVGRELADALLAEHGTTVGVTVRSVARLAGLLTADPLPEGPGQVTISFLAGPAPEGAEARIGAVATAAEPYAVAGSEVWVRWGDGQARSVLAAGLARVVGVGLTTRTVGTVAAIVSRATAS